MFEVISTMFQIFVRMMPLLFFVFLLSVILGMLSNPKAFLRAFLKMFTYIGLGIIAVYGLLKALKEWRRLT